MEERLLKLLKQIECPGREYTPIPFWFINAALSREELKRQILDFKEKGIDGFVLHPRIGIPKSIEYLSDVFMDYVKYAVKVASQQSMAVVLYDEGMYPSGSAHGMVVEGHPEWRSVGLTLSGEPEGKVIAQTDDGRYLVQKYSGGTIRGIHFGEDDGEPDAPPSADILNPAAVERFISLTHERYYSCLKEYFGNTILGFFTDEPSVLGRNTNNFFPWTDGFEEEIIKRGGQLAHLSGLFDNRENETTILYHRAILERECEVYYKALSDWCGKHGIALMGHPHQSDDIEVEKYFDIPGQDLVFRWVSPENGGLEGMDSVQAKCSADAAYYYGRRRNSNECFGVCSKDAIPWYMTADDMKWYIDWLAVRGVNLFIPHAFYYSIEGERKQERPPDVGPNNIWWKHFRHFSDYMKRVSYLMTEISQDIPTAILCENRDMPYEEVKCLYENQVPFRYLPKNMVSCRRDEFEHIYDLKKEKITEEILTTLKRDIYTDKECPQLRCARFFKEDCECFFLVNEGEEPIDTDAHVKGCGEIIAVDVWNNTAVNIPCENRNGEIHFELRLGRRESVLLILADCFLGYGKEKRYLYPQFTLKRQDSKSYVKEYEVLFSFPYPIEVKEKEGLWMAVKGEEMVECYVNDMFAGVSFWNPHEFSLSPCIRDGVNRIKLIVTGNVANRYSAHKIEYGLEEMQ